MFRLIRQKFYPRQHSLQILHCCAPFELLLDALRLGQEASPVRNLVQAFADHIFADGRRRGSELDIAFGNDAEAGCELDEREIEIAGVRMRVEGELRSLKIGPFEGLGNCVSVVFPKWLG